MSGADYKRSFLQEIGCKGAFIDTTVVKLIRFLLMLFDLNHIVLTCRPERDKPAYAIFTIILRAFRSSEEQHKKSAPRRIIMFRLAKQ